MKRIFLMAIITIVSFSAAEIGITLIVSKRNGGFVPRRLHLVIDGALKHDCKSQIGHDVQTALRKLEFPSTPLVQQLKTNEIDLSWANRGCRLFVNSGQSKVIAAEEDENLRAVVSADQR